ncbi:MAG: hypothetical protein H7836_07335 [Magnetococcus sp. YQC-3]
MPRIKRDVLELEKRAINSLTLAIELFNRPHEHGRPEGVLILLHHAFEMLLKAVILKKAKTVHDKNRKYSYGFDKCLDIAQNQIALIDKDERTTLSILDAHRDTATHYYQELSEDLLYLQAQAATTLFDDMLYRGFQKRLANILPSRVLPISTSPPKDLQILVDNELSQVDALLKPGSRSGDHAMARLRPILAMATASREQAERVTEEELRNAVVRRRKGEAWSVLFPEIAQLCLDTEGDGISVILRIKKDASHAVRVAKDGETVVGNVIKQEVNIFDKFSLGRDDLAKKVTLSGPKTSAMIVELDLKSDPECYREIPVGSQKLKRYSKKALDKLRDAISNGVDPDAIWKKHRHLFGKKK